RNRYRNCRKSANDFRISGTVVDCGYPCAVVRYPEGTRRAKRNSPGVDQIWIGCHRGNGTVRNQIGLREGCLSLLDPGLKWGLNPVVSEGRASIHYALVRVVDYSVPPSHIAVPPQLLLESRLPRQG